MCEMLADTLMAGDGKMQGRNSSGPRNLILSTGGGLVRETVSPDNAVDLLMREAVSGLRSDGSCENCGHVGSLARMFPASLASIAAETGLRSSWTWKSSGMGGPTEFLTRDSSESPRGAVEFSLSRVLEDSADVPRKYWLSARAAAGILRRAEKRGKQLPAPLLQALTLLASTGRTL